MRTAMFIATLAASIAAASVQSSFAQGGGGGGGGGGSGGGSAGAGAASTGSASGTPNAGSAGAGSLGVNRMPQGPANAAGLNNSGNDPSGIENAPNPNQGTTTGRANPSASSPQMPHRGTNSVGTARGTNSVGTANSSGVGGGGVVRSNGTRMPGRNAPTTTKEGPSDSQIDVENKKVDRMVKSICRGC
jgi:hypothetical protein